MYEGDIYPGKALVWAIDAAAAREDVIITRVGHGQVWSRKFGSTAEQAVDEDKFRQMTTDVGYKDFPAQRKT